MSTQEKIMPHENNIKKAERNVNSKTDQGTEKSIWRLPKEQCLKKKKKILIFACQEAKEDTRMP